MTYDTKIDRNGFDKGLKNLESSVNSTGTKIKNIVAALGINKIISTVFSVLNNSIDGAISRLDTLNNFPKVMSNLGIASNDAQKSINKMSDKLSGLPTTLDAGAQAVQRFTSANKDVNKSTDYFLAFNNALLAGGASAEIQANAFAAALLMEKNRVEYSFKTLKKVGFSNENIILELSKIFAVSASAMNLRVQKLGLM